MTETPDAKPKPKIGRPTKAETAAKRKASLFAPPETDPSDYFFVDEGYDLALEKGVLEKFQAIDKAVANALVKAGRLKNPSSSATALNVAWMTADSAAEKLVKLRRQLWVSQRITEQMEALLVENVVAQNAIKSQIATVQLEIAKDLSKVPVGIANLARRMHFAGVTAEAAGCLTESEIVRLAKIVNNRTTATSFDDIHAPAHTVRRNTPEDIDRIEAAADERIRNSEINRPAPKECVIEDDLVPPAPDYGPAWNDSEPAPDAFWDSVREIRLPYHWKYREVGPDEAVKILSFQYPEWDTWENMKKYDSDFRGGIIDFVLTLPNLEDFAKDFVGYKRGIHSSNVQENWWKGWLLLVWARHNPEQMLSFIPDEELTYFAGVAIPVSTMGPTVGRELIPNKF